MLTHQNIVSRGDARSRTYLENTPDDVDPQRAAALVRLRPVPGADGLQVGGTLVLEKSFAFPQAMLQTAIAAERVTGLRRWCRPWPRSCCRMDLSKLRPVARLRYLTNTAAALPPEHIPRLQAALSAARASISMYGLTECKRGTYLPPDQLDGARTRSGSGMPEPRSSTSSTSRRRRVAPGASASWWSAART